MIRALDFGPGHPGFTTCSGARFSKVPKTFQTRKAICEAANHLFWKVDILTRFQGNKKQNDCEFLQLKSSPFLRYKVNCHTRKWPVKFRDFRETGPCPLVAVASQLLQGLT